LNRQEREQVGGVAHVFVSALAQGRFQTPVQVDSGLAGPSSQPVIAADDGGLLLVAFVNAGELYVVQQPSSGSGWQSRRKWSKITAVASGSNRPPAKAAGSTSPYHSARSRRPSKWKR